MDLIALEEEIERQEQILKFKRGCYDKSIRDIYMKLYREREYHYLQLNKSVHTPLQNLFNEVKEIRKSKNVSNIKTDYFFVTINPDEEFAILSKFVRALETIKKKKWINDLVYVFEQRGINDDEIGKGFHAHLIINRNGKSFSKFCREILNTLYSNNIYDKKKMEEFYDKEKCEVPYTQGPFVVEYTEPEHLQNRFSYILGKKLDKDNKNKNIKQEYDIPFRKKNKLERYYIKGEFFQKYIQDIAPAGNIT